jgi:hypothetical protein
MKGNGVASKYFIFVFTRQRRRRRRVVQGVGRHHWRQDSAPLEGERRSALQPRNGAATSSSPFRSLFHGDEDIAAPNPVPSGAMSGSGSGSGSNRMLHTVSNPMAIPIPIPTRAAWAAARAPRHSSNGTIRGRHPSSHAELLKLTAISLRNHVRCAVSHLP